MCRLPSSVHPCRCNKNQTQTQNETHILAPLIPLTQDKPPPDQTHPTTEPTWSTLTTEAKSIAKLSIPMILTALLLYSRAMISMLFLGRLGELPLAGGSLAIGFANITGYSVISGLAMGMEPICGQAVGANKLTTLGLTLQRAVLMLLCASLPISLLWLNMHHILNLCGQDPTITLEAHSYILFSLPDLISHSLLHPLRIYLRTQSITLPLTYSAILALALHVPINYLLVSVLQLGIRGVALGAVWTNINLVLALLSYVWISKIYRNSWVRISSECLRGWGALLNLAIPSCISVCLEWWWYEIMILLCGLLVNPRATVASMGVLIQTTAFIYIFPSSLSFGVSTRISNELGANNPCKAKRAAIVGLSFSFILGFSALGFTILVRDKWARLFTNDKEIISLTSLVLPIIGLCELGNCPQTTGCGVLRGTARPRIGANINLGSFYMVGTPVAVVLAFLAGFDFEGLWLGLMAAQATCVVLMLVVIFKTDWVLQAERARELTGCESISVGDSEEPTVIIKIQQSSSV